jgi:DNA-binding transcriptional MerR regulator
VKDPRVPDREAFRIGEVASLAGVSASLLRFWEGEFPRLRPTKTRAGQRLYRRADVEMVLRIRDLLHVHGYTIPGARKALAQPPSDDELEVRREAVIDASRNVARELLRRVSE